MTCYIFDYEVFACDWIFVAKPAGEDNYTVIHNDSELAREFMEREPLLCGFNNKSYDQFIHKAVLAGWEPAEIKELNDWIIAGNAGWEYPGMKDIRIFFNQFDLKDDCEKNLSLKAIEGHLGADISESEVPFNLDRPLTAAELQSTVKYCMHDVKATERLLNLRKDYLESKIYLGGLAGIPPEKSLYMTNAKLSAAYLGAERRDYTGDERDYKYPDKLRREYIPDEVFAFFDRLHDKTLSDDEVFSGKLNVKVGECPVTLGFGGIHGALPQYTAKSGERVIRNFDVSGFYPHIMTLYGYTSRAMLSPDIYANVLERRTAAKKAGDKATANALKLVCNSTYGATLSPYNDLYDPLMARSVCITGQLFLLELIEHLYADVPDLRLIQCNTDGLMIEFDESHAGKVKDITDEWQRRTGFELEEDKITLIVQKDVSNYIAQTEDGRVKVKGTVLTRGVAPAGAFNINNNATVVSRAVVDYFIRGTPARETVFADTNPLDFQIIAKASGKYSEVFQYAGGEKLSLQKCNRVYASTDASRGTLFKIYSATGSECKMANLPEHCFVDNRLTAKIGDISREWYVNLAERYISDFAGEEPAQMNFLKEEGDPTMENKQENSTKSKSLNIYQKLSAIRKEFLESEKRKSGVNTHAEFKYFELRDIIPITTELFEKYHVIFHITFANDTATGTLIDTDNPKSDTVTVAFEMAHISEPAKFRMNEVQARGAELTYMRRYLYFLLLDTTNSDEIDSRVPLKVDKPATVEERQKIKKDLTNTGGDADEMQVNALKALLKKIRGLDSSKDQYIQGIAVETNAFKSVSKARCEELIAEANKILAELDNGDLPF